MRKFDSNKHTGMKLLSKPILLVKSYIFNEVMYKDYH